MSKKGHLLIAAATIIVALCGVGGVLLHYHNVTARAQSLWHSRMAEVVKLEGKRPVLESIYMDGEPTYAERTVIRYQNWSGRVQEATVSDLETVGGSVGEHLPMAVSRDQGFWLEGQWLGLRQGWSDERSSPRHPVDWASGHPASWILLILVVVLSIGFVINDLMSPPRKYQQPLRA